MEIKIIKKCNLPIDSIQDLGQERNKRAVKNGLAVWHEVKPKKTK